MKFRITNRQFLSVAIIIFYLIPLLFFSMLSITSMPGNRSWTLFSLGLLVAIIGTFALTLLLYYWELSIGETKKNLFQSYPKEDFQFALAGVEEKIRPLDSFEHPLSDSTSSKEIPILEAALKISQEKQEQMTKELEQLTEDNNQLELKALQIAQDFADYKLFSEEQLKQKQLQLSSFQQMIEDQRNEMEKRQDQIYQLDTKIHDLSYEIKTLLYLNEEEQIPYKHTSKFKEMEAPIFSKIHSQDILEQPAPQEIHHGIENPVKTPLEASALLKKCISMAQKLTGANYHGNESSPYREYSSSFFAIDQRRLYENLRGEPGAIILVYSQIENKLLFVNNETKKVLGWNPEKFLVDFQSIVQEGMQDWRKALSLLAGASESQARLLTKTKQGQEIVLNCHLGVIPTGLFRNHVIGILYPV